MEGLATIAEALIIDDLNDREGPGLRSIAKYQHMPSITEKNAFEHALYILKLLHNSPELYNAN